MVKRQPISVLKKQLADVRKSISEHPFSDPQVLKANEVIEANNGLEHSEIEKKLIEQQLPALEELGRIQLKGSFSWWALHRKQRKILQRLARAES